MLYEATFFLEAQSFPTQSTNEMEAGCFLKR